MEKVISIEKQNFASLRENHYHSYKEWKGDFYLWQLQRQKQNMDRFMVCKKTAHGIPRRSVRKAAGRRKTILPAGRAGVLGGRL